MFPNNRVLLLINNEEVLRYLREQLIIEGGYSIVFETAAEAGLDIFKKENFDLVITSTDMPGYEGTAIIKEFKAIDLNCVIIVFTETVNYDFMEEASELGIYDFISKPINQEKLFFMIRKGIELHTGMTTHFRLISILKDQNTSLQKQNILLANRIEGATKNLARMYEDLRTVYMRTIRVLAQAIDARDHYTHDHSENVARYAVSVSRNLGLSLKEIEVIRHASELHDLGKIGVADSILTKPTSLTQEEWQLIKQHPQMGAQILEPLTFLGNAVDMVRQHHEHFDGSGYPAGYKGDEILLGARIIHLADAFEAMTSPRSYRQVPYSKAQAVEEIKKHVATQFDPVVVEAFLKIEYEL
jgi:putative nucleotidyltransferase with HDIG domain